MTSFEEFKADLIRTDPGFKRSSDAYLQRLYREKYGLEPDSNTASVKHDHIVGGDSKAPGGGVFFLLSFLGAAGMIIGGVSALIEAALQAESYGADYSLAITYLTSGLVGGGVLLALAYILENLRQINDHVRQ